MKAVFIELPAFERHQDRYLDDESFRLLQDMLMAHPEAGDLMEGTGGLRKARCSAALQGQTRRLARRLLLLDGWPGVLVVHVV